MKMNFEKLIPDYLEGNLDEQTLKNFDEHMKKNRDFKQEVEKLKRLWDNIEQLPEEKPSPQLETNFYTMLQDYKLEMNKETHKIKISDLFNELFSRILPKKPVMQFAFSFTLLLIGLFLGSRFNIFNMQNNELSEMRTEMNRLNKLVMLSLLEQSSPADRLKGVIKASDIEHPDDKVFEAIFRTLDGDPNENVRLASVELLGNYANRRDVQKRLISSFKKQESPMVKTTMINLFVDFNVKDAIELFRELISKNNMNVIVKEEIKRGLEELSSEK